MSKALDGQVAIITGGARGQQFLIAGTGAHHERLIQISPQPLMGWSRDG